jgi:predicted nucleotidyltransferase
MSTPAVSLDTEAIARFCRKRGIRRLSLFGSVIRGDFKPGRSDVDVLVEFFPGRHPGLDFFSYERQLAALIGQPVEMQTPASLSRHFRDQVLSEALTIYEHA